MTPDDLNGLAGEYVLGTLDTARRRAVQQRLPHDADLRDAVEAWERRLLPLADLAAPVQPSAQLWRRIERSIAARDPLPAPAPAAAPVAPPAAFVRTAARPGPWQRAWQSVRLWQGVSAAGFVTAALLAGVLLRQSAAPLPTPQFMVVLVAPQVTGATAAPGGAGWVIQARDSRNIQLIPLGVAQVPADRALQFWTKADGWDGPVSLGLVRPGQALQLPLDRLPPLQPNQLFELTLEPSTGSPTGKPTGPVQAIGRAVKVS